MYTKPVDNRSTGICFISLLILENTRYFFIEYTNSKTITIFIIVLMVGLTPSIVKGCSKITIGKIT